MTFDPAPARWYEAVTVFTGHGWSKDQWHDLHAFFAGHHQLGSSGVAYWLRNPPAEFTTPISPSMVRDLFDQYGWATEQVLNAVAAGGTERFCAVFLNPQSRTGRHINAVDGWVFARDLGLTEPQAVGWAATDYLGAINYLGATGYEKDPERDDDPDGVCVASDEDALAHTWTTRFGPDSYLYVLAGITLPEAATLKRTGTSPTEQQLRVMVALAGYTLPAGV